MIVQDYLYAMADSKVVSIVPLNGANYPTWKVQCRMALVCEGLWSIVAGTEEAPPAEAAADRRAKFQARMDKALALIAPSLLYLVGDPVVVWKTLENQFQKKTWANKLMLRWKLYSLRLKMTNQYRIISGQ